MKKFDDHGCEVCRHSWERDATINAQLGYSPKYQTFIYRCVVCGTYWEERGNWIVEVTERRANKVLASKED